MTKFTAHTPGPWRVYIQELADKEEVKRELCRLVDGTPDFQPHLVYVTDDDWDLAPAVTGCGKCSEANGRLIAAAPDLLEALKECASHAGGDIGDIDWEKVRAAIARATGDSKP